MAFQSFSLEAKRRTGAVVGLDLGEHTLKAVEVQRTTDGFEVMHTAAVPVPPEVRSGTSAAFGAWLTGTLRRSGIRTGQAVWAIPRHRVIFRWLQLPAGTHDELTRMVHFQAGKDLPLPVEQVRFNFATFGEEPVEGGGAKTRILLAAVPADVADRAAAIADAAGLSLAGAIPSTLATWTLAAATCPDMAAGGPEGAAPAAKPGEAARPTAEKPAGAAGVPPAGVAVIDIGWASTEVLVGCAGQVRFSRSAPVGLSGLEAALRGPGEPPAGGAAADPLASAARLPDLPPAAAPWADQLVTEIVRSLRAQQSEGGGVDVGSVRVAGGGAMLPSILRILAERLGVPVTPLDLGGRVTIAAGKVPVRWDPLFAAATGAAVGALQEGSPFLNLLGSAGNRRRLFHIVLKIAGIAAAVLLLGALATGYYFLSVKESAVAELRGRFKELKPRMEQVLQTEKKVALASQWGPARVPLTDLLLEITTLFPPEAYVTTMTVDESGLVRINGRSKTNQVMSKLVTSLNGSRTFANASLGAVTKNNAKDEFKYDYSITVQIRGQAPEKTNGEKAKGKV